MAKAYRSFSEFYPFYLSEHRHPVCRALHYIGTTLVLCLLCYVIWYQNFILFWLLPIVGYGFAWVGHFFVEKNRPATFQYPVYSFLADWVMLKDFVTGQISDKLARLAPK